MFEAAGTRVVEEPRAGSRTDGDQTTAAVADLLAAARRLADAVTDGGADGAGRRVVLAGLGQVDGVLAGVRSAVLLAERDAGTWQRPGIASFEAALGTRTRTGLPDARRQVRQAETLATMPVVADAVRTSEMPLGHLDALARVRAVSTDPVTRALDTPVLQDALVRMARTQDVPTFTRSLQRITAELDPASLERAHHNQRARRFLHLSDQPDGTHLRGLLDRVAGHRLRLALEATGERPGPRPPQPDTADDDAADPAAGGRTAGPDGAAAAAAGGGGVVLEERTSEQARADALDVLARRILSLPQTASGAAVPAQISLLMTEDTFTALRTHHTRSPTGPHRARTANAAGDGSNRHGDGRADGDGGGDGAGTGPTPLRLPDGTPVPPVTLEDGTPVPFSTVAQALCDCDITRLVINADDIPVNLGRTARLYTGTHRRAVIARDRHCTFPGCDRHARWCEIHHITWWDRDNGPTSLNNAALLCSYHHHQVHQHNLTIDRHTPTRPTPAPGTAPGTGPRAGARRDSDVHAKGNANADVDADVDVDGDAYEGGVLRSGPRGEPLGTHGLGDRPTSSGRPDPTGSRRPDRSATRNLDDPAGSNTGEPEPDPAHLHALAAREATGPPGTRYTFRDPTGRIIASAAG